MRGSRFWNRIGVFILIIKGGGLRRPYMAYSPGHDLIKVPPLGNVGLSHNYYDQDATDFILTPQKSQQKRRNAN